MATLTQLYEALKNADAVGATDDARALADEIHKRKSAFAPPTEGNGILPNVAAATKDAAYGIVGAPVDAITMLFNAPGPVVTSTDPKTGEPVKFLPDNAIGSSKWLAEQGEKVGIVDPDNVKAVTPAEKLIRSGTEAALLTVAPELLLAKLKTFGIVGKQAQEMAESVLGSAKSGKAVVRNAVTGAAGGAGAQAGVDLAPEPLKPLAAVLGALVGGVGGDVAFTGAGSAVRNTGNAVGEFFDPVRGTEGVERAAGRKLAAGLDGTVDETLDAIDTAVAPVSGAKPTLAEVTGDRGAATMAAGAKKVDPVKFEDRAAQQAQERVDFLKRVQSTGGAEDMAPAITRHNDRVEDLLTRIDDVALARGTAIRDDIAAGRRDPIEAGEEMRSLLATEREARRRVESALHEAVDPDGSLTTRTNSLRDTAKRMGTQRSTLAKPIAGEEKSIVEAVDTLEPVTPYRDLVALKTRIGDEMRLEARTNGKTAKWGRLSQYAKAVSNDLRAPAVAQAKQEAAAVKAGEIRPEETFLAKVKEITDELDRNAASFGTDVTGTGAVSAGPPTTGPFPAGATGQAELRPGDASGGESLPGQDGGIVPDGSLTAADDLVGDVDPEVAARLRAADDATIDRVNTFDNKTLKPILARPSAANPFTMSASQVPARIFKAGPAGGETVAQYRAAVGDVQALPVIEGYAIDDLVRVASRPDGTLDPKKITKWRNDHADALRSFPALDARLANATTASETAGAVAASRRAQVTEAQKGAAAALAGATDPGEITTIVGRIFSRADSVSEMQKLRRALRNDPDANAGLRKTIVDHMLSKAIKDVDGTDILAPERLRAFLDDNEQTLRVAGFTDPEIRSMRELADEASRAAAVEKSARPGSGTSELQSILKKVAGPNASLYVRMAVQTAGHSLLPFLFGGPLVGLASLIGAGAVNALRAKGLQSVDELFREALLDPALARKLLAKVNSKNLKPAVNSFRQQLTRSTLGGTMSGWPEAAVKKASGRSAANHVANGATSVLLDQMMSAKATGGPEDEMSVASR